ncbi:MAG TPA: TetR/AcrR family transcriptional regulator [Terracidiphilus sp.]|nr:TetR/AcrR family transcriptional regulator [Terracidiphilus sp.]
MVRKGTGAKRLDEPTLTFSDWVEGALQLISEAGLRALTIDALAARLGVTKGSFYWHFKGRPELLAEALGRWEHRATTEAIAGLSAVPDARQRIVFMLEAASQQPRSRSLYAALAEAADDPIVRRVLNRVASARIGYLERCYRELGLPALQAKVKAVLAYAAYRGLLQLAHEAPAVLPADWPAYAEEVIRALGPERSVKRRTRRTR